MVKTISNPIQSVTIEGNVYLIPTKLEKKLSKAFAKGDFEGNKILKEIEEKYKTIGRTQVYFYK